MSALLEQSTKVLPALLSQLSFRQSLAKRHIGQLLFSLLYFKHVRFDALLDDEADALDWPGLT